VITFRTLAVSNWSHVGLEPCSQPTAPVVRWANLAFVLLGIAAVIAVREPQAYLVLAALVVQAIAGTRTLSLTGKGRVKLTRMANDIASATRAAQLYVKRMGIAASVHCF
jgi:hypothetical protein